MKKPTDPNDLDPGSMRGRLILAKALAYAIAHIDSLEKRRQEWSDRQDMANLLTRCPAFSVFAENAVDMVAHHTQRPMAMPVDAKLAEAEAQPVLRIAMPLKD